MRAFLIGTVMPRQASWSRRSGRRGISLVVAGALTATVLPAFAASAATVAARDLDSACPPARVPSAGFDDTRDTTFEREIDCVVAYDVASGLDADTYGPLALVNREQMATFLAHVLEAAGRTRPSGLPNAFPDDDRSAHRANIDWLAHEGIVGGFEDGTYRPTDPVTRAQMASFLNNVIRELTGARLASSTDFFADDAGSPHEANINGLAQRGIVTGTGDDTYDPAGLVTRGQMAAFLAREVDHLVDTGVVRIPFGPQRITVTPTAAVSLATSDNASSKTADRGRRSYTADIPIGIERVTILLMPSSQVGAASDGTPRFTSNAAAPANAGVSIEVVDGRTIDSANGTSDATQVSDIAVGRTASSPSPSTRPSSPASSRSSTPTRSTRRRTSSTSSRARPPPRRARPSRPSASVGASAGVRPSRRSGPTSEPASSATSTPPPAGTRSTWAGAPRRSGCSGTPAPTRSGTPPAPSP